MSISWEDEGVVLARRRFGEHDAIVTLLTAEHGRTAGLVKGGGSTRMAGLIQPGNLVKARWRARLDSQLGNYTLESIRAFAAEALGEKRALAGLAALCAMADSALPEREAHQAVYRHMVHLLEHLALPLWEAHYVLWELALLRDMGYGLDLAACAATGARGDLAFVSPRSGRAVSRAAAAPYIDRLLPLPAFFNAAEAEVAATAGEIVQGLALTGYFFERHVYAPHGRKLPAARARFAQTIRE